MKTNINKTAYAFFIFLSFVLRNKVFKINEISTYLENNYNINLQKEAVLKYIRTMKFLGFKLNKINKQVYSLERVSFSPLKNKTNDTLLIKCIEILKNYSWEENYSSNIELLEKLCLCLDEKEFLTHNSQEKEIVKRVIEYPKLKDICYFCRKKFMTKIYLINKEERKNILYIEPIEITKEDEKHILKGFEIEKKENIFIDINEIIKIEQTRIKNKHTLRKTNVTLKFLNKFANTYVLKDGEEKIKKEENNLYVKSFYYDKKTFFDHILRYMHNCEIIAPTKLRQEFIEYVKDLYQKYDCSNVK